MQYRYWAFRKDGSKFLLEKGTNEREAKRWARVTKTRIVRTSAHTKKKRKPQKRNTGFGFGHRWW